MQQTAMASKYLEQSLYVILRFSGQSNTGQTLETRQIVYVTPDSDKIFLSREACSSLGLISRELPTIGSAASTTTNEQPDTKPHTPTIAPCNCPCDKNHRQKPPTKPQTLPFPATAPNRGDLQTWLLNHYKRAPLIHVHINP
jgi:hypothetical protein